MCIREGLQNLTYTRHSWPFKLWWLFNVSHLSWHGTSVYNGHLSWPVTRTLVAKRMAAELSLHFELGLYQPGIEPLSPIVRGEHSTDWATSMSNQVCRSLLARVSQHFEYQMLKYWIHKRPWAISLTEQQCTSCSKIFLNSYLWAQYNLCWFKIISKKSDILPLIWGTSILCSYCSQMIILVISISSNRIIFKKKIVRDLKRCYFFYKYHHYVLSWFEENLTQ